MACVKFLLVALSLVSLIGHSTSDPNPFDLDPLGIFSSGESNDVHGKSDGLSASLDTAGANSFAVDKNLHIPDPIGGGGVDANLGLAAADSFSLSKSKGKKHEEPPPKYYEPPHYYAPPPPHYNPPPPPPPRRTPVHFEYIHEPPHYAQGGYNDHDIGGRPNNNYG
jgi:hypothetical protein